MLKALTLKMRTKMPKLSGISATREMIKAFVNETRALYAPVRFSIEAVAVIFASGEMEMETKSRPSSAALAPTLALKKLVRASGTIGYSFLSGTMFDAVDKQMSLHSDGLEGWDDRVRSFAVLPLPYLRSSILASL